MPKTAQFRRQQVVSLREARAKLSSLTKQVREGKRIVITNHGTPIADLVQHGLETAPFRHLKHPGPLPEPIELKRGGPSFSELILNDREG